MTFNDLQKLYPSARVSQINNASESEFVLYDGYQYLMINVSVLNKTEKDLLSLMFKEKDQKSMWYQHLINGEALTLASTKSYHFIHFHVKYLNQNHDLWLKTFKHFFENPLDAFYINNHSGLVVLDSRLYDLESLKGFIAALDDDFSTNTSLYIGSDRMMNDDLIALFKEETLLFHKSGYPARINNFSNTYLQAYVTPHIRSSSIGSSMRQLILSQDDMVETIICMWEHEGNVTSSAQALFIHRNTLNYRIDKFHELTGLSLRHLDDLLLAYLLVL
ncbi:MULTISPECIES: helix-turn-helix domain-containing protein [Erysipelothrix]|uniref:helix-turn-helix domain-containing protein n=1 Tax=Erysipelothrix TaxID=1647 RepID=UPI001378C045|nr:MULTISPECIES: helix-turn-helix domain-containing protein [unclassified Erysipelothrix]MBK2402536.1 Fis family transcriptional regulator [Erysipelothrix sp. strain 2 (EsS2-6-Brazil)]MBK2403479.1 Fis family transcriptional regulator [Erysipelothrix sp. strain 2 (EsS2-7-Brazil)]NBA01525.1 Fis family transcriptional regulator [Erysipelothrix rhusiopathiae]